MQTQRTQSQRTVRWLGTLLLFGVILIMAMPSAAWADGTAAGSTISNTATITFSAGGGAAINVTTPTAATFIVDRKVDVLVARADATYVPAAPGENNVVLAFNVTNQGNATFDLNLSAANGAEDPFAAPTADDFDVTFPGTLIFRESNANSTYESGTDLAVTTLDDLAPETPVRIYVLVNIPAGQTDTDVAGVVLTALATETDGTALAETGPTALMDTAFTDDIGDTDALRDASHSDGHAVQVRTAYLNITKTATVIWDPVNFNVNPLAIPDAYVQYTVTITHDGTVAFPADLTNLSDTLVATLIFDPNLILADGTATPGPESGTLAEGFKVVAPANRAWGGPRYYTSAADADGASFDGTDTITIDFSTLLTGGAGYSADGELQSGESVVVTFNAIIE